MSIRSGCGGWITRQAQPIAAFRIIRPKEETALASAYAVFYILAAGVTGHIIRRFPLPFPGSADFTTDAWYALVFKIGLLLIVPGIWFFRQGYRIRDLLPGWKLNKKSAAAILVAFGVGLMFNQVYLTEIEKAAAGFSAGDRILRIGIGVLLPLLMAAIPEEVFHRGILQTRLELLLGRIPAIALGALLSRFCGMRNTPQLAAHVLGGCVP